MYLWWRVRDSDPRRHDFPRICRNLAAPDGTGVPPGTVSRPHTSPLSGPLRPAISGAGFQLARMKREVLAHLQLHSIDLCQEAGCRQVVVCRIRLCLAQIGNLALKVTNPLKARIKLLIVGNHDASEMISTMPRRRPSRFKIGRASCRERASLARVGGATD